LSSTSLDAKRNEKKSSDLAEVESTKRESAEKKEFELRVKLRQEQKTKKASFDSKEKQNNSTRSNLLNFQTTDILGMDLDSKVETKNLVEDELVAFQIDSHRFVLSERIVSKYPKSLLATIFQEKKLEKKNNASPFELPTIFLQLNNQVFQIVLDWLRS